MVIFSFFSMDNDVLEGGHASYSFYWESQWGNSNSTQIMHTTPQTISKIRCIESDQYIHNVSRINEAFLNTFRRSSVQTRDLIWIHLRETDSFINWVVETRQARILLGFWHGSDSAEISVLPNFTSSFQLHRVSASLPIYWILSGMWLWGYAYVLQQAQLFAQSTHTSS